VVPQARMLCLGSILISLGHDYLDMQKGLVTQLLTAEILTDCGNLMFALNFSLIHSLKLKYYANFTYNTQIVNLHAHLNHFKDIFSEKSFKIAIIFNIQNI
jgi:NADH:ubiquinone oxidoreductase subunit K